jgi:putative nucleotidyltransferase with HDIG domain
MSGEHNLKKVEAYISKLPALPVTITKVMEICNNPATSPVDLNKVIGLDPVLMARVLKLINSAYYGLSNQVTSLARAIIMLGLNTVKNLALSTAVLGTLGKKDNFQALNMQGFWRHSLCVGVTSKLIARKRRIDPKILEEYFIAGLLHDIGKIPLNNTLAGEYIEAMGLSDRDHRPLYQSEKEIIGYDHTDVGVLIGEAWKLGEEILDTIRHHHSMDIYTGNNVPVVYTVAVADLFANTNEIGFSGNRYPEKIKPEIFSYLGITWDYLDELETEVHQEIEKAQVFLKISEE